MSDDAARAAAADQERITIREQYFRCQQIPAVNDFRRSDCDQQRVAARMADNRSLTAAERAREGLDALAEAVQAVEVSCEFPLAVMMPTLDRGTDVSDACESFLRRRQGAPLDALRVLCDGEMSAEECRACLGPP